MPQLPAYVLRTTLAGAILAELDLLGAITLEGKYVKVTGAVPETEFQRELEMIRDKPRPHKPKRWVSMLEGPGEVQRVYERMASLGIVEHVGEKHLGLFRSARYPEKDHGPEAALLKSIEAVLSPAPPATATPETTSPDTAQPDTTQSDAAQPDAAPSGAASSGAAAPGAAAPDARTMALIALLQAAELLERLFPEADLTKARELARDYWPSRAVEDELRMIRITMAELAP